MPGFVQVYCRTGNVDNEREHSNSREEQRPCGVRLPSYRILPFNASLFLGTTLGAPSTSNSTHDRSGIGYKGTLGGSDIE